MNYLNNLKSFLLEIIAEQNLDVKLEMAEYQDFAKMSKIEENKIYIVVKYNASDISFHAKLQPINILAVSEQNSLDKAVLLLKTFVNKYNFSTFTEGTTYVKQSYSDPVSLGNFEDVTYGYRGTLYLTGELYIMEDVVDVKGIKINDIDVDALGFNLNYAMAGNTQQKANEHLSSTVKSTASLTISMTVPMISVYTKQLTTDTYNGSDEQGTYTKNLRNTLYSWYDYTIEQSANVTNVIINRETQKITYTVTDEEDYYIKVAYKDNLISKVRDIVNGKTTGNADFKVTYSINNEPFYHYMKLISAEIVTAPNQVPSLNLGFMR